MTYEQLVSQYISEKYTLSQEIAIQRQRDTKPKEFAEYNSYCEECKVRAKANLKAYNAEQERIAKERQQAEEAQVELLKQKQAEKDALRKAKEEEREATRKLKEEERAKEKAEQKAKHETERIAKEENRKNKTKVK